MKLRQYLILFSLLVPMSIMAQVGEERTDFSIGVTSGVTINTMDFQPRIKQKSKTSPMYGVAARYICEKYFSTICGVEVELLYQNLGWQELIEDGTLNQYTRNLHYFQLPLLMQMGWGRERRGMKFIFEAGPQFGYYLNGTEDFGGEQPWDPSHRPNGINGQYGMELDHKFDYGITGGIGLELSTGIGHFLLQGRYYYGLSDIYDNSKGSYFARSANQTINVKITYLFDIVKTKNDKIK